jgi:hypothetical protein
MPRPFFPRNVARHEMQLDVEHVDAWDWMSPLHPESVGE